MIDPEDNLKIAMLIYENKSMNNEAGIRTAVSRCYYSSLLAIKPFLRLEESDIDSDDLHNVAMTRVQEVDKGLGDRLKVLYERRLKADMADVVTWDRDVISDTHSIAKTFNNNLRFALGASGSSPP